MSEQVEARLVACTHLVPISSVYVWKQVIEHDDEVLITAATRVDCFDSIVEAVPPHVDRVGRHDRQGACGYCSIRSRWNSASSYRVSSPERSNTTRAIVPVKRNGARYRSGSMESKAA